MVKLILSVLIVLALLGGAIKFVSTEEDWSLVMNKEEALHSVQNGAIVIYDFVKTLINGVDPAEKTPNLTTNQSS